MDANAEFLKLLLRHQPDLKAFLASVVRDRTALEDLFQEVCLALWQSFENYDPARPFGAWARKVAAHKALQAWDKKRRSPKIFSPEAIQAVSDAYDRTEPDGTDEQDRLRRCIGELPTHSREILALRYEKSLKLGEIARRLDRSLDAVHKLLSRIRTAIQSCLERKLAPRKS